MERESIILPTERSIAAASYLESQHEVIIAALALSKDLPLIEDLRTTASGWADSLIATLRGNTDASYEWCSSFIHIIRDKGGRIGEILVAARAARDITIRFCSGHVPGASEADLREIADAVMDVYLSNIGDIYAEKERAASSGERQLRRTMASLMERAFVTLDGEAIVRYTNTRFCDLTGLAEDSLIGFDFLSLCDEETAAEIRRALRQRRPTSTKAFEGALVLHKRIPFPLRFWALPMFDDAGIRSGLAVAMAETGEGSEGCDAASRARVLEDLAKALGIGCYTIDEDRRIISGNSLAQTLITVGAEDNGTECCRRNMDASGTCSDCFRRKAFETGQAYRSTAQHRTPSGAQRWVEVTSVPLLGRHGKVARVTKFIRDITEQRIIEDQCIRQQRTSFASQLAIAVAHQLRNPLGVMVGFAEMLSKGMPPDQCTGAIDRLLRNAIRCKEIVQNLLEFGRGAPGEHVPVSVNDILRERVLPAYPSSVSSRITWLLADGVPPVECAPEQLTQVFRNLIDNALAVARSNITVESSIEDDTVCVRVIDDGPGIPEEVRPRLFEPFVTTHGEAGGIGLGLCLSRAVVQEHRGLLYLDESAAPATCFVVKLPPVENAEATREVDQKPEPAPRPGRSIVIVEDEADLSFLLTMALQGAGYEVTSASTGAQAVELLQKGTYDAAVIDMLLGDELGGKDLYHILLSTNPGLAARSLFVTGDTMNYETRRFLAQSKRPFLEKPFMVSDFMAKLEEIAQTAGRG